MFSPQRGRLVVDFLDALNTFEGTVIEVHISNVHKRRGIPLPFLRLQGAEGVIAGFGTQGYLFGLRRVARLLAVKACRQIVQNVQNERDDRQAMCPRRFHEMGKATYPRTVHCDERRCHKSAIRETGAFRIASSLCSSRWVPSDHDRGTGAVALSD